MHNVEKDLISLTSLASRGRKIKEFYARGVESLKELEARSQASSQGPSDQRDSMQGKVIPLQHGDLRPLYPDWSPEKLHIRAPLPTEWHSSLINRTEAWLFNPDYYYSETLCEAVGECAIPVFVV